MKNLLMMMTVVLIILGVVYIVKQKKTEPVYAPAFNAGVAFEAQPTGNYDGEYTLVSAKCPGKNQKESDLSKIREMKITVRGMQAKLFRKAGRCEIIENLDLSPNPGSTTTGDVRLVQIKQGRVECAPDCPCHATITGSVLGAFTLSKKEILVTERIRSEKDICDGKLPAIFKYTASASSASNHSGK